MGNCSSSKVLSSLQITLNAITDIIQTNQNEETKQLIIKEICMKILNDLNTPENLKKYTKKEREQLISLIENYFAHKPELVK